jgi:acylphosphatase
VPRKIKKEETPRVVRCLIRGRVQGVFYRSNTASEAIRLEIDGWAKNLPDGQVEVVASGNAETVTELCGWLWSGSESAQVSAVLVEEWSGRVEPGFLVL